jgi:hypothetical protein
MRKRRGVADWLRPPLTSWDPAVLFCFPAREILGKAADGEVGLGRSVRALLRDGLTDEAAAKLFQIGETTVHRWNRLRDETGGLEPGRTGAGTRRGSLRDALLARRTHHVSSPDAKV